MEQTVKLNMQQYKMISCAELQYRRILYSSCLGEGNAQSTQK
jgi:hypothetical protein